MMSVKIKRKLKRIRELNKIYDRHLGEWLLIIFLLLICIGMFYYLFTPQINLNGKNKVIIDYNSNYMEKGYTAKYQGKDISKYVKVDGSVNNKKLGKYTITYSVNYGTFKRQVKRVVEVKDLDKPVLSIDDSDIYLCPGDEVVPDKVEASDNYDGDLSSKVINVISKDKITYKVKDSSGNTSSVSKKIIYKDIENPIITLNDSNYMYAFVNEEFSDPGVNVSDNCDKDITSKLEVENNVNVSIPGTYTINYKATDNFNNSSTLSRTVIVSERNKKGTIYLTFDDGPNSGTTDVILDILKEEGVEATFFVTSRGPDELIKREYDEGHTIALHSSTHDYASVYASADAFFNDLYNVRDRVKRITGYESNIIRFPGGASNTVSRKYSLGIMTYLTKEVINRGFKYYDWNISSGDATYGNITSTDIYNNVINNLRKDRANMVLLHDIKTYTRDALRDIIKYGKDNGYTFEKITDSTEMITQKVNN